MRFRIMTNGNEFAVQRVESGRFKEWEYLRVNQYRDDETSFDMYHMGRELPIHIFASTIVANTWITISYGKTATIEAPTWRPI